MIWQGTGKSAQRAREGGFRGGGSTFATRPPGHFSAPSLLIWARFSRRRVETWQLARRLRAPQLRRSTVLASGFLRGANKEANSARGNNQYKGIQATLGQTWLRKNTKSPCWPNRNKKNKRQHRDSQIIPV